MATGSGSGADWLDPREKSEEGRHGGRPKKNLFESSPQKRKTEDGRIQHVGSRNGTFKGHLKKVEWTGASITLQLLR